MDDESRTYVVQVCFGRNCTPAGSRAVLMAMEAEIAVQGLTGRVTVLPSSCRNRCEYGPSVNVLPEMAQYAYVDADTARRIVREHFKDGAPVAASLFRPPIPPPTAGGKRAFVFDPSAFRPRDDDE